VVDAVRGAVEIQAELARRNGELPEPRRMHFRIGINLGDVIVKEGAIYGDGVNVAARLEALAEPGGVCISWSVHDQVEPKLKLECEYLGEQEVKNIARPVRAYKVVLRPDDAPPAPGGAEQGKPPQSGTADRSDQPSIAVLPFESMSNDSDQMYFADGIVEDIITELSKFRWFHVIARNTSFTYKEQPADVRRVSQELGVRYVLEGSVRRMGEKVRITAQLIEGATGNHIWAERFDCELGEIFEVQDEITSRIAASVDPELYTAEVRRAQRRKAEDLGVWNYAVRGRWHVIRLTEEDNAEARQLLEEALKLDPDHALSLAFLAYCHITAVFFGWSESPPASIETARNLVRKAVSLDENDPWVQCALGLTLFIAKDPGQAILHYRKAIDLNPNFAVAFGYLGMALAHGGEPGPAIEAGRKAIRLSPRDPELIHFQIGIGTAHFVLREFEQAAEWARKSIQVRPDAPAGHRLLAASLAHLGHTEEARGVTAELLRLRPGMTTGMVQATIHFKAPADSELYVEGLRKAGLPD
jgi:adenylate cyclase